MEFLVGVFVIGLLWLLCMILVPVGAVLLMAPRTKRPKTQKSRNRSGPAPQPRHRPIPTPSPDYIPRWDGTRRWQAKEDLANFEELLKG